MKQKFSTKWKASRQPRKQRKYSAKAPIHIKTKMLGTNLSKELRKKHGKRNVTLRKNDVVKILRGKFKKKQGKVLRIELAKTRAIIEGLTIKKMDGSKAEVPIKCSNLQIVELNLDDKKRIKKFKQIPKVKQGEKKNAPEKKQSA